MYSTNTDWLRNRATNYGSMAQTLPLTSARESARELVLPAARWLGLLPSWTLLAMIVLATAAVCAAVIVKTKAEFEVSTAQRHQMLSEIDDLRRTNVALEVEIRRLTSDSNTIELAARERLGMVMPSDVVVPIESIRSTSGLNTVSFIR